MHAKAYFTVNFVHIFCSFEFLDPQFSSFSQIRRAIKYIAKNNAKINIDVIRASHAHQVPHVGLPQIAPVTKAIILKTNPDGAKLFAIRKKFLFLKI